MEVFVGSESAPAIILILKILVYGVMGCCVCYNGLFWERFWLRDCVGCLLCLFWACFCLANAGIDCRGCFRGWLIGLLFLVVLGWMIVCCYCISWLILRLIDMIVDFGSFLLNGCDFVRKKKNYELTVHCNVAFVKPYVKMSALWFKRLFLLILVDIVCCENVFLFWTSFCEWHELNRLSNSDGYCSCVEENAAGCSVLFWLYEFCSASGSGVIAGEKMIFDCK